MIFMNCATSPNAKETPLSGRLGSIKVRCRLPGRRWAGWILTALACLPLRAGPWDHGFRNISIEDGLAQNSVTCILSDRRGFIWFGTHGGLNRYDGYNFKVFDHSRHSRNCLSHDQVNNMVEDEDGEFWIGTIGGGLNHYDPLRDRFTCFRSIPGDPGSLSNDSLRVILPVGNGRFWIGTDNGLNLFDSRKGSFSRYLHAPEFSRVNARNAVYSLYRDGKGDIWIGTGNGLYHYDAVRQAFTYYASGPLDRDAQKHNQINAIYEDGQGTLWLGSEGGMIRFDRPSGTFQFKVESSRTLPHLYRSRIFAFFSDNQGRVWVATESGLYLFPRQDLLKIYFHAGAVPKRLLANRFIISIYQDREGIIWAGSLSGVFKYDLRVQQFSLYSSEIINKEAGSCVFPVTGACRDFGGRLWIGTYKYGLIRLSGGLEDQVDPIPLSGFPADGKDTAVSALRLGGGQTLWIGTNRGLYAYDLASDSFAAHYAHSRHGAGSLSHDQVTSLFEDRSGRLWVGTQDGLNLLDRASGTFLSFRSGPQRVEPSGGNHITAILQDRSGALWIGSNGGGVSRFDPGTGGYVQSYRHRPGDPSSLSSDSVNCLLEDRRGRLWIGTNSGGLNLLARTGGRFTVFTSENGLPNNDIQAMQEDRRGNLWLSTNRGLCCFDPQLNVPMNFTTRDGLQGDEFWPMSSSQNGNGELFFGGINGLTSFYPERIRANPLVPPVVITSVTVHNRDWILDENFDRPRTIKLNPGDKVVSFAFSALSFSDPRRNQYAYRIEGLDDEWIPIGNRHEITVSNLRPGHYVFRVKGSNNHGVWNETGAVLGIDMRPPWWESWWFRLPAVLLLLLALLLWRRNRTRRMALRIRSEAAMEEFLAKHGISQREKEIVLLVLRGKSNKEIEEALFIAMGTVKNHVYNIYQKIGVKNRAQLMALFKNLQVK